MSVYVDDAIHPWRGKMWCHLVADSDDELHEFAKRLGLRREWFQTKSILNHYDITENKRQQAVAMGAIPLTREQMGQRLEATFEQRCKDIV